MPCLTGKGFVSDLASELSKTSKPLLSNGNNIAITNRLYLSSSDLNENKEDQECHQNKLQST